MPADLARRLPNATDADPLHSVDDPFVLQLSGQPIRPEVLTVTIACPPGNVSDIEDYVERVSSAIHPSGTVVAGLVPRTAMPLHNPSAHQAEAPVDQSPFAPAPMRLRDAARFVDRTGVSASIQRSDMAAPPWPGPDVLGVDADGTRVFLPYSDRLFFLSANSHPHLQQWSPFGGQLNEIRSRHGMRGTDWLAEEGADVMWVCPPTAVSDGSLVLQIWAMRREAGYWDLVIGAPGAAIPGEVWEALTPRLRQLHEADRWTPAGQHLRPL